MYINPIQGKTSRSSPSGEEASVEEEENATDTHDKEAPIIEG
jgi:hypothetical protein